jgi:hypothetical protein
MIFDRSVARRRLSGRDEDANRISFATIRGRHGEEEGRRYGRKSCGNSGYESFDGAEDKVKETKECCSALPFRSPAQNWKQLSNFRGNGGEEKKCKRESEIAEE